MSVPRSSRWVAKLWRSVCRESVLRSPAAFAACLNSRPNWRVVSGRRLRRPGNSQRCSGARPASYAVGRVFHHCRNRSRTSAGSITCRSPAFARAGLYGALVVKSIALSVAAVTTGWIDRLQLLEVELDNHLQLVRQLGAFEALRQVVQPGAVFLLQVDQSGHRCRPACWPWGDASGWCYGW